MTKQILLQEETRVQRRMSKALKEIRVANGIKNPFNVSRELGQSTATLRNIEKGLAFPTVKTLNELIGLYVITPIEKQEVLRLKDEMLKIRRELKEMRKNNELM